MSAGAPRLWAQVLIPEHHPEVWWGLPGYVEAAKRGFTPVRTPVVGSAPKARVRRSLADLTEERDALVAKRDALAPSMGRLDHGVLSGIRRRPNGADRKRGAATDRDLERYTKLTARIDALEFRIKKEG